MIKSTGAAVLAVLAIGTLTGCESQSSTSSAVTPSVSEEPQANSDPAKGWVLVFSDVTNPYNGNYLEMRCQKGNLVYFRGSGGLAVSPADKQCPQPEPSQPPR